MNYNYLLLAVIALCLVAAFIKISTLNAETAKTESVTVIDEYINKKGNSETGDNLSENEAETASISQKTSEGTTRVGEDGSEISTMYDRYGNKTETRSFNFHPRLSRIMLISSPDGQRRAFVYAQNGDVKDLPENMLDQVMTAAPDEIANAAGIVITQPRPTTTFAQTAKPEKFTVMRAAPNDQYQIQNQSTESGRTEENREVKTTTENSEKNTPSTVNGNYPKVNTETPAINHQPEEK